MDLIIVESPSKAKTIEKYLGKDYVVDASGGHVRDLPVKSLGVDIKNNFEPDYQINPDKSAVLKRLSQKTAKAQRIFLATDPDREGEAISWHLAQALNIPIEDENRIIFNEISQKAVKKALSQPRRINIDLVDAQQARRVLDRLVGYKISPLLCKKIQNNLSAGRVQSVALRLIIDRENEITGFVPKEYWNITALLCAINDDGSADDIVFKALLTHKSGKKFKPENAEQAQQTVDTVKGSPFTVKSVKSSISKSHAPAPFTTSTLQQDASNKLSMPSPTTMSVAQNLYEGVNIDGEGQVALVTYIRTDSVRVSQDAQAEALEYIKQRFGAEYAPKKPNFYKSKKGSQDAHEAIRPISIERTPDSLKGKLQKNHFRLYKLIYDRFLASQMSEARYSVLNVEIESADYTFKSSGKTLLFKGYTAAYEDFYEPKNKTASPDDDDEVDSGKIPPLKDGQALKLEDILSEQKFTKPPQRFTDASLIKVLEEKGIGRPSTYASIIAVLLKREYTVKEGKYLAPTPLAFSVNELMVKYFDNIVDVRFTARMEEQLDEIEDGGKNWKQLIADFYPWLEKKLKTAQQETVEYSEELCPDCGVNLVVRVGRYGKFLGCPNYPKCRYLKPLTPQEETPSGEKCDKCGSEMVYKNGKYGKYLACSNYPDCKNIKSDDKQSDTPCENCGKNMYIRKGRYGEYLHCPDCRINKPLNRSVGTCPKCGKDVYKRTGKSGKIFYGCSGYPDCDFVSWDAPADRDCPKCGQKLFIRSLKSGDKFTCHTKDCGFEEQIKGEDSQENK